MEEEKVSQNHLTSAAAFVEGGIQDACDDACSICLEPFCDSDPSALTTCKHEFHLQCVLEWCQRSSHCPMCWQAISLKDPSCQELLEAVEHERNLRMNPPRSTTIFHHPTLGDFELQHFLVNASESELEERIIQHLAAAAAMGRARQLATREGRSRPSSQGRPHYLVLSTLANNGASGPMVKLDQFEKGKGVQPLPDEDMSNDSPDPIIPPIPQSVAISIDKTVLIVPSTLSTEERNTLRSRGKCPLITSDSSSEEEDDEPPLRLKRLQSYLDLSRVLEYITPQSESPETLKVLSVLQRIIGTTPSLFGTAPSSRSLSDLHELSPATWVEFLARPGLGYAERHQAPPNSDNPVRRLASLLTHLRGAIGDACALFLESHESIYHELDLLNKLEKSHTLIKEKEEALQGALQKIDDIKLVAEKKEETLQDVLKRLDAAQTEIEVIKSQHAEEVELLKKSHAQEVEVTKTALVLQYSTSQLADDCATDMLGDFLDILLRNHQHQMCAQFEISSSDPRWDKLKPYRLTDGKFIPTIQGFGEDCEEYRAVVKEHVANFIKAHPIPTIKFPPIEFPSTNVVHGSTEIDKIGLVASSDVPPDVDDQLVDQD